MDVTELIVGTILTVGVMVALYHGWIIPKVVNGIKTELPGAVEKLIDEKLESMLGNMHSMVDDLRINVRDLFDEKTYELFKSVRGSKGAHGRAIMLAEKLLLKEGPTTSTFDKIIEKYGAEVLEAISEKSKPVTGNPGDQWV